MNTKYTIKQAVKLCNLPASTIRYYEKQGLIYQIERNDVGIRIFSEKEITWLAFLKKLKDMELPIAKMKQYAQLREQGNTTIRARMDLLSEHQQVIIAKRERLKSYIALLDTKVRAYQELEKELITKNK